MRIAVCRAATVGAVSRRLRFASVAAVALAAAGGVAVGALLLSGNGGEKRPEGIPPFVVDLGVRQDAEAQALRRAARAYKGGERQRVAGLLTGFTSTQAEVGKALAPWPEGSLERLEQLGRAHPGDGAVLFHLGLARFWDGDTEGALAAWRLTTREDPDTLFAVRAANLLFRGFAPGLPVFIPSFRNDPEVARLPAGRQLVALQQAARRPDVRAKLLYGVALQRLERPVSAREQFTAAARLAPKNVEAQVADAVGRFDKAQPEQAFSLLGPLTRRHRRSATVRFHLGLMLLWLSQLDEAKQQLRLAAQDGRSPLAREAERLLIRLETVRKPR
jgi:tetratricopeptide (TPR) repeat protein